MVIERICISDQIFKPFISLFMQSGYGKDIFDLKPVKTKTKEGNKQVYDFYLLGIRVFFLSIPATRHWLVLSEIEGPKSWS